MSYENECHRTYLFRGDKAQPISPLVEAQIQQWLLGYRADILDALAVCESEIERILGMALLCATDDKGTFLRLTEDASRGGKKGWAKGRGGVLYAQYPHKLGENHVRIDFVLVVDDKRMAIECDGHDTHSSPLQRTMDAQRDRALVDNGWISKRFTGREIKRGPHDCAADILKLAGCTPGRPPPLVFAPEPRKPRPIARPPTDVAAGARGVLMAIETASAGYLPRRQRP